MKKQTKIYLYLGLCVTILMMTTLLTNGTLMLNSSQESDISIVDKIKMSYPEPEIFTLKDGNIMAHVWSSDGSKVAYVTCPDGQNWNCDLMVADWNLQNEYLVYTGIGSNTLMDYVDDWILFMPYLQNGNPSYYYGMNELWKIRDDGSGLTQLSFTEGPPIKWNENGYYINRGTVSWGRFIPGTNLIYFSAHDGNGWYNPYTTTDDGTFQWKKISSYNSFTIGMSPSGSKLLWGDNWNEGWQGDTDLYVGNWDGSGAYKIKRFYEKTAPLVLSDENTIILSWTNGDLRAINMDGTNERVVIDDEYMNYWDDYHPFDGQAFSMRSNRAADGNDHIFKINSDGNGIIQLTEGDYNDFGSMYSPNGQYILYRRQPSDNPVKYELVVKNVVVTEIINLIDEVNALVDDGVLNKGQGNSLIVKLETVLKKYSFKNPIHAGNQVNAFINHVNAFIQGGKLTSAQGQSLIAKATPIMNALNY